MAKKKRTVEAQTVEPHQITNVPPTVDDAPTTLSVTRSSTPAEVTAYKAHHNIPVTALLAWGMSELPRYFKQNDNVIFKDRLPYSPVAEFDTPIWFEVISSPNEVEALEELFRARIAASSRGLKIVN